MATTVDDVRRSATLMFDLHDALASLGVKSLHKLAIDTVCEHGAVKVRINRPTVTGPVSPFGFQTVREVLTMFMVEHRLASLRADEILMTENGSVSSKGLTYTFFA